jgi:biotin carboxylase
VNQGQDLFVPEKHKRQRKLALLGYSIETMEAAERLGYEFVAVVLPGFDDLLAKDGVETVTWDFNRRNEESTHLFEQLTAKGCSLAIPLYEETVEWAGALNARMQNSPRLFNRTMLLRDKAMMKRKAQMSGIKVGVFEEVESQGDLRKFLHRVNEALAHLEGEVLDPVHVKPLRAAGSVGHRMIRTDADVLEVPEKEFPLLAESHLGGQEFSVEAFIHDGKVRFMNINEYIRLGHHQFTPAGRSLEERRPQIRAAIERLIHAFDIRHGVIHPEYFVDGSNELAFGEVANRVPGGNIFELIERAYGFNPYEAVLLASDSTTSEEELAAFFPHEVTGRKGHCGNLLVYPKGAVVSELNLPGDLLDHPYFEKHTLVRPIQHKVTQAAGFGAHYGVVYFFGEDPARLKITTTMSRPGMAATRREPTAAKPGNASVG